MTDSPQPSFVGAARQLLSALVEAALRDPAIARELGELSSWLGGELRRLEVGEARLGAGAQQAESAPRPLARPEVADQKVEYRTLRLGGSTVRVPARVTGTQPDPRVPVTSDGRVVLSDQAGEPRVSHHAWREKDWPTVLETSRKRARVKSRACRWALSRDQWNEAARQQRGFLVGEAKRVGDCYAWPLDPLRPLPDDELLELAAEAYENLAIATDLIVSRSEWVDGGEPPPEEVLFIAAEAQSALWAILQEVDLRDDRDQVELYIWIKETGCRHSIYVPRHMRREDPSDPRNWADLRERLRELLERLRVEQDERRARKRLADKLSYQVGQLQKAEEGPARAAAWADVMRTLTAWVDAGYPPSSRDVCDPLIPVLDALPEEIQVSNGAQRVLQAVDDLIAARSERSAVEQPVAPAPPSPEVLEVRRLLRDKTVVLIGGERRVGEEERLRRDLELAELRWQTTRPHRSLQPLIEQILRPEVDLVLVAVRWSDHAFSDLRAVADAAGKPLVQLPGGYGTNQVAHQILVQASVRLGGVSPRS